MQVNVVTCPSEFDAFAVSMHHLAYDSLKTLMQLAFLSFRSQQLSNIETKDYKCNPYD
jgi:hypothetical protein